MKKIAAFGSMLALVVAMAAPAYAGDAASQATAIGVPQPTALTGWITDSYCGAKNANADGAKCARDCYKKGAKLELIADGKTYQISDQKAAFEHIGHEVVVTGTLEKDTIKVDKIETAKKDKA